jgi:hypothetical protein
LHFCIIWLSTINCKLLTLYSLLLAPFIVYSLLRR